MKQAEQAAAHWLGSFPNDEGGVCSAPHCRLDGAVWVTALIMGHGVFTIALCSDHASDAEGWLDSNGKGRRVRQHFRGPMPWATRGRVSGQQVAL